MRRRKLRKKENRHVSDLATKPLRNNFTRGGFNISDQRVEFILHHYFRLEEIAIFNAGNEVDDVTKRL